MRSKQFLAFALFTVAWLPSQVAAQTDITSAEPTVNFAQAISCVANANVLAYYAAPQDADRPSPIAAAIAATAPEIQQWREQAFSWEVMADGFNLNPAITVRGLINSATLDIRKQALALENEPETAAEFLRSFAQDCKAWQSENPVSFGAIPPAPDYSQGSLTLEHAISCAAYTSLMAAAIGEDNAEQAAKGEEYQLRWIYLAAMRAGGDFDAITPKINAQIEKVAGTLEGYENDGEGFASSLVLFGHRNACRILRKANPDDWEAIDMSIFEEEEAG